MSFFKKLFSGKASVNRRNPYPPRVRLTELHRIGFRATQPKVGTGFKLRDISINGMGVLADEKDFRPGFEVKGDLTIDAETFAVEAIVRHCSMGAVGFEFKAGFGQDGERGRVELQRAIENYLKLEILALSFRKVDSSYLKADPRGDVSWFTDGKHNEIYCVTDPKGIVNFHVTFLGNYLEGGRAQPLRFAYTNEDVAEGKPGHKGSTLLDLSTAVDQKTLELVQALFESVESMPGELRTALIRQLQRDSNAAAS